MQGTLIDVLMPPLSSGELLAPMWRARSRARGWWAAITFVAMLLWPGMHIAPVHVGAILFFGTFGSAMLALLGVLTGIWAEKFDQGAMITNFVVQPLTLLSGTFYTLDALRQPWNTLGHLNPFFFAIDGFRFGFPRPRHESAADGRDGPRGVDARAVDPELPVAAERMEDQGVTRLTNTAQPATPKADRPIPESR